MKSSSTFHQKIVIPDDLSLESHQVNFIDFDDSPDTARRVAAASLGRFDLMSGMQEMPSIKADTSRRFQALHREASWRQPALA